MCTFEIIAPLQLVSHVVQNLHVGEEQTHWEKTKRITILYDVSSLLVLSQCVLYSQHRCFVLRERPASKGLLLDKAKDDSKNHS